MNLTHTGRLLNALTIQDTITGEKSELAVNGLFYAIGHKPNTLFLKETALEMDGAGYLITRPNDGVPSTYTNIPGVFACGDVQDKTYRQAVTAAGSGCMSALDCERWLEAEADKK
jgi:thioredoxin reductase (NADPH)